MPGAGGLRKVSMHRTLGVRFSGVVFPEETIVTELWKISPRQLIVQAKTKERGELVISAAAATIEG